MTNTHGRVEGGGRTPEWGTTPVEKIFARIVGAAGPHAVHGDEAVPLLLLYVLELQAAQRGHPFDDCIAACETIRHAGELLGVWAATRATDLTITSRAGTIRHGDPHPAWNGPGHNGHCILWLPDIGMFIDPTAERFPEIARHGLGPIVGRSRLVDGDPHLADGGTLPGGAHVNVHRDDHTIRYRLAGPEATQTLLGHPLVTSRARDLRRAGANLAGLALETLRIIGAWDGTRTAAPYPKVRAYLNALDDSPCLPGGADVRFRVTGMGGTIRELRLDEVGLC